MLNLNYITIFKAISRKKLKVKITKYKDMYILLLLINMGNATNKDSPLCAYCPNNGFILKENTTIIKFIAHLQQLGLADPGDFDTPIRVKISETQSVLILPFKANNHLDLGKLSIWRMVNNQKFVSDGIC